MSMMMNRRQVLTHGACLVGGLGLGMVGHRLGLPGQARSAAADETDTPEARFKKLGLDLPIVGKPRSTIAAAVRAGDMLYLSGHIAIDKSGKPIIGKVGKDLTLAQAEEAARRVGLTILSVVRAEMRSFDRVVGLVKTLGMVNCTPEFTEQSQVIDAFSKLMIDVFGNKAGKGARSAVGMASLPLGVAVEIECIFRVSADPR